MARATKRKLSKKKQSQKKSSAVKSAASSYALDSKKKEHSKEKDETKDEVKDNERNDKKHDKDEKPKVADKPESSDKKAEKDESDTKVEFQDISSLKDDDDADIISIYDIDDEGPVDMSKMDQKTSKSKFFLVGILVVGLILVAVAYLGYRVFSPGFGVDANAGTVTFEITAEQDRVASGDVVTFVVEYENKKAVDIRKGKIEIFYPDGFYYQSATVSPEAADGKTFDISNLKPGAGGKIKITGQLVGVENEEKEASALLTYEPKNFANEFQESSKTTVMITTANLELVVDVPEQVQAEQEFVYEVSVTNTAKLPLRNIKILMVYPDGFTFVDSSLPTYGGTSEWRMDSIEPGQTETLEITGTLAGDSGDTKEIQFQLGVIELDNSFNVQIEQSSLIVIVNPEIELSIEAPELVETGELVPIKVTIKNTSEAELKNVKVKLDLDGALFKDNRHFFDTIEKLGPLDEETLEYSAEIKNKSADGSQALSITASVPEATVEGNQVSFPNVEKMDLKVKGGFDVIAQGQYFDDDLTKIGKGPIPPVVNKETTYVVRWNITNGSNTIDNLSIITSLPDDVIWPKKTSKAIEYDAATRQVSYSKDTLLADAEVQLEFEVTITPTNDDINKLMVITRETVVSATDAFTKEEISMNLDRITTDLPNDEGANGKGVVEGS